MKQYILEIPKNMRWSDEELFEFCQANQGLKIERTAEGQIMVAEPVGGYGSSRNAEAGADFVIWNRKTKGGKVFDSSGGFLLPSGAMKAPDVAWVRKDRWEALTEKQRRTFPPLCPDFVLELRSFSDRLPDLQAKMEEWMENGCRLGWLIDPKEGKSYVYRPDQVVEIVVGKDVILSGEEILEGFELDLGVLDL